MTHRDQSRPEAQRHQGLFACVAMLCLPLAFQLVARLPVSVPESMWMVLVLSVWATLSVCVSALIAFACCLHALLAGRAAGLAGGRVSGRNSRQPGRRVRA